jgi:hypothetical protein
MPRIQRRSATRRELNVSDLSLREQCVLTAGNWQDGRGCETLTSREAIAEVWEAIREELLAEYTPANPGRRPWVMWLVELLPRDKRRQVEHIPALPHTTAEPPYGEPWASGDGYESSYRYLRRRELLADGEIEQIRARHNVVATLEYYRQERQRTAAEYRANVGFSSWELADILEIFGPAVLQPDELRQASEYRITK